MSIEPDFDTFVGWLCRVLTEQERAELVRRANIDLDHMPHERASVLEASLESFVTAAEQESQ